MPFKFRPLEIEGVVEIEARIFDDERGAFAELYKKTDFRQAGIGQEFVQFNRSVSERNVLRGLHYQLAPKAQGKLIQVTSGKIFDVAIDIRRDSETYKRWVGRELAADDGKMLYIPAGLAHGFCVLSKTAEVIYYCTDEYAPELERGIIWHDSELKIDWPVPAPLLSERDAAFKSLRETEH